MFQFLMRRSAGTADGCYRPELAAAFRRGARELCNCDLGDRIEVPEDAPISPAEGGVWVTVHLYVSDADRAAIASDEDPCATLF